MESKEVSNDYGQTIFVSTRTVQFKTNLYNYMRIILTYYYTILITYIIKGYKNGVRFSVLRIHQIVVQLLRIKK